MADLDRARDIAGRMAANIGRVIVGKDRAIELGLIALMCRGHILIEDVPGVGKTMLARSLARSAGTTFRRIQFTPDLLPSDVTGVSVFNQKTSEFEYRPGPIVSQIVLADEINRATPKTQSALLEAMEERQVTVEGETRPLPRPFAVIATQNPIEYEGTFPLPEAQLDRFLLRISLGYPDAGQEMKIVADQRTAHPIESLEPVATPDDVVAMQDASREVFVDDLVREYVVSLVGATRDDPDVGLGCSPRGSISLFRAGQALALIRERDYVLPDDIKELAGPVLGHRMVVSAAARMRGVGGADVTARIVSSLPVPGARAGGLIAR